MTDGLGGADEGEIGLIVSYRAIMPSQVNRMKI
jgi:hypothetical protein